MARIQWHGSTYNAEPVKPLEGGDWLMTMLEHGPRFAIGTLVRVKQSEIIEMAAAEMPATPAQSAASLQQAMDEERKTLPTVEQLIARRNEPSADTTAPASPAPETPDMSSKLSQLAALAADTNKTIEDKADKSLSRLTAARAKAEEGLGKLDDITAEIEAGTNSIEDLANQLSNGGPTTGKS